MADDKENRDVRLTFAAEQSRLDRQHAVDYVKAVLQLLIGTSGVATTASLALIGALKNVPLVYHMIWAFALYFVAVLSGMLSAHFMFLAKQAFAHRWEGFVFGYPQQERDNLLNRGKRMQKHGILFLWLGFAMFGLATAAAVWAVASEGMSSSLGPPPNREHLS